MNTYILMGVLTVYTMVFVAAASSIRFDFPNYKGRQLTLIKRNYITGASPHRY